MEAVGLLVTLEARAGKEADAEAFLKSAQPLALNEKATLKWYAIKIGPGKFGIFDTFANDEGRNAHLAARNFRVARHPPKDDYEAAEDSNVVRANGQIKKLLRRVRYHF